MTKAPIERFEISFINPFPVNFELARIEKRLKHKANDIRKNCAMVLTSPVVP
jgi:hypothetical protein